MSIDVSFYDDPETSRNEARKFLAAEPVLNNLVLTLLTARIADPQPGRYWVARETGEVVGIGLQSPLMYAINLTAMMPDVAAALADAIGAQGCDLPGAMGEARIAARFAGQWTERCKVGAHPTEGQRVYEARTIREGPAAPGQLARAAAVDRTLICDWMTAFQAEIGGPATDVEAFVERRVSAGEVWLWNDGAARCMAATTAPLAGVSRVQYVYTAPQHRRHGYAEALVRSLTRQLLGAGLRPMLFTELDNPSSNSIYRRIGYQAVAELTSYRFDRPGGAQA